MLGRYAERGMAPELFVAVAAILPAVSHAMRLSVLLGAKHRPACLAMRSWRHVTDDGDTTDRTFAGVRRSTVVARAAEAGESSNAQEGSVFRAMPRASDVAMLVTRSAIHMLGGFDLADKSDIGR